MEDTSSQGSRRTRASTRPDSSSSRETRMTPQTSSNNSSTINLPRSSSTVRPASGASLLQDRIRERKGESARQNRRQSSVDFSTRDVQSSPTKAKEERRPSSAGRGMGVKRTEEQVSTLTKQNFNLKLELHHRRERQTQLEARLEAAEKLIQEQRELQEVNEQLVAELEKRDQAVEEAVGIIVALEDKVEKLLQERGIVQNLDEQYDATYSRAGPEDLSSSPPTSAETRLKVPKVVPKMPSFLSDHSEGTEALRSLYLPVTPNQSDATLPKLQDEGQYQEMHSPILSVLSESSFISVYGRRSEDIPELELPEIAHRKTASVEKWIDERAASVAPARAGKLDRKSQYLSINNVIASPLQRLEKLKIAAEQSQSSLSVSQQSREPLQHVNTEKTGFDHQHVLPPTPDTISTGTLRHLQNSSGSLGQDVERTFLYSTSTFGLGESVDTSYPSSPPIRPRSAGETIQSPREVSGWDADSQADEISSTASMVSADMFKPRRVLTPDLFTFGNLGDDDDPRDWGRNMMFNSVDMSASFPSPAHHHARRSTVAEHPSSDQTVTEARYTSPRYEVPVEISPRPKPPPHRRSSLNVSTKIQRLGPSTISPSRTAVTSPSQTITSSPITPISAKQDTKKIPFPRRFFHRSESSPNVTTLQSGSIHGPRKSYAGSGMHDISESTRATPPPIRRNRPSNLPTYRPSSAGAGMSSGSTVLQSRRGSKFGFGGDGAGDDELVSPVSLDDQIKSEKRKWLGFGRKGV